MELSLQWWEEGSCVLSRIPLSILENERTYRRYMSKANVVYSYGAGHVNVTFLGGYLARSREINHFFRSSWVVPHMKEENSLGYVPSFRFQFRASPGELWHFLFFWGFKAKLLSSIRIKILKNDNIWNFLIFTNELLKIQKNWDPRFEDFRINTKF